MPGNTADSTTLAGFLEKIEAQHGRSDRAWIMDRGIPTEATLAEMRDRPAPVRHLVGTPKGRLTKLEHAFAGLPWRDVRESVEVKLLPEDGELHVPARSPPRIAKERGCAGADRRSSGGGCTNCAAGRSSDQLLLKLGAAKKEAGRARHLVEIGLPGPREPVTAGPSPSRCGTTGCARRDAARREGHYLLRSSLVGEDPATLWRYYMRLAEVEQAFEELEHDLALRPIFHQREERIEARFFVASIAYCLHVAPKNLARPRAPGLTGIRGSCTGCPFRPPRAPGLTTRAALGKFATLQMVDVHPPTTDGRRLVLPRHTQPNADHQLLLHQLDLRLPEQPAPGIS